MKVFDVKNYPLIHVEWVDSVSNHGWNNLDEVIAELHKIITIGFLLKESDDAVVISPSIASHYCDSPMIIPKVAIIHRENVNHLIGSK